MTKTKLLDLPNELLSLICEYLTSIELIQAFSDIQSNRIQALIQPFISHLDISQETDEWVQTYLSHLFQKYLITSIRLKDKHITTILQHMLSNSIESMHIFNFDWSTDMLKVLLNYLHPHLKGLSVTFPNQTGKGDLASYVLQSNCQLEYLHITGRFQIFNANEINTCSRLTHLSIELEGMPRVFMLMKHLPNIQQLKVKFCIEGYFVQSTTYMNNAISSNTLKRVIFTGCTKYFDQFSIFSATFGSTIEHLMINIQVNYITVDGKRLELDFLNNMPRLSSLDLIIHSKMTRNKPINMETFQNSLWDKFKPIVYWYDPQVGQHTIFTLPYKFDQFQQLSNNFLSTCISNRDVSLYFDRVRILSLICVTPLTMELFELIKTGFPNVKVLELTDPNAVSMFERGEEPKSLVSPFSDEVLLNETLQLPTITRFSLLLRSPCDSYLIFRRLLLLLPNLVNFKMSMGKILYSEILKHVNQDSSIRNALNRIKNFQIVPVYYGSKTLNDEELHKIFPNAEISFDYD